MKDNELYTNDEMALFEALENDVDDGIYKPLEDSKLNEKKRLFKQVATRQIKV